VHFIKYFYMLFWNVLSCGSAYGFAFFMLLACFSKGLNVALMLQLFGFGYFAALEIMQNKLT